MSESRIAAALLSLTVLSGILPFAAHAAVGRTQGAFNVSPSGAATYQIPISVPSGPKGIQPNLALTYNSNGGDTTVGFAWSLAGLSAITRCNQTVAQDGAAVAIEFSYTDKFCLNGNRLRATSGTYGYDQTIYQAEMADFTKVTSYGALGNGPAYFIAQGKDGLTYEYGHTGDSQIIPCATTSTNCPVANTTAAQWLLNKVSDRAGNNYVVTYGVGATGSSGIGVPLSISYTPTSAGSTTYNYLVTFNYITRVSQNPSTNTPALVGYLAGFYLANTNLLSSVTVSSGGTTVHQYNLAYNVATTTRARLATVTECAGSAGTDCLLPITISYSDGGIGVGGTPSTPLTGNIAVLGARDFDGNHRDDILYRDESTKALYILFSTTSGYGAPVSLGVTYTTTLRLDNSAAPTIGFGDLTAQGRTDILLPVGGVWWRYSWNGSAMAGSSTGLTVYASAGGLVDINGDGLPDLVTAVGGGGYYTIYTRLNTSSGGTLSFFSTQNTAYSYPNASSETYSVAIWLDFNGGLQSDLHALDFNNDGRKDIAIGLESSYLDEYGDWQPLGSTHGELKSNGTTFSEFFWTASDYGSPSSAVYADINNDNCTDIATVTYSYTSTCNGTYPPPSGDGNYVGSMDWNGDGKIDLLGAHYSGYYAVSLSTGSGIGSVIVTSIALESPFSNIFVFDQNGDGKPDFGTWNSSGIAYRLHDGVGTPADFLSSITDGYGVTISPTYVSIAASNYTEGTAVTYPEQKYSDTLYVVSQVVISDGVAGTYTQTHNYTGAVENAQGRGFSGFQSHTVSDSRANTPVVKTYYKTDFPYTGMAYQQDVYQSNGTTLISHTVNTPATLVASTLDGTTNNQRYFPYVASTATDTYEVGGTKNALLITQSAASFTYDSYGNLTASSATVTDKDSTVPVSPTYNQTWTTTASNTIAPNTANWCLGIPTQSTVTKSATSVAAITRTTSFTPDYVNCRVTQSIVEPSSATYKVTTGYAYDAFGNVNSQTVTGISMTARTTTANWGTTGQFPISATNALSQTSTAGYDYNLGVQTSATDPNGIVTSWQYDNFGRKTLETRPDSTSTSYSYNDCASVSGGCQNGDPAGSTSLSKMVVIATSKDTGGTAIRDDWTYLDQFDRTIVSKTKALSGGYTRVGTQYDAMGRTYRQTAPCDAASCSVYWITNTYDALGRVTASSRPISASNATLQTTSVAYQGLTTTTTDPQSKASTKVTDPNGWLRRSQDHDGYYQAFTYDAFGSVKTVVDSSSNALFSASYAYGLGAFQTQTVDMDLGTWNYTPNALGEVASYTDAKASAFTLTYDKLSRPLTSFVSGVGTTTWTWGATAASYNIGQLQSLTVTSGPTENYTYDNKGRLSQKQIVSDATYNYNYTYDAATGLLDTMTYPVSTSSYRLALKYVYANGMLSQVKDNAAGTIFWQVNTMNARGEITQETLGNGIVTNRSFDAVTGWLNSIQSGVGGGTTAQNEAYLFDKVGNVTQRQNNTLGLTESFYYDNLYRLDYSQLNAVTNLDMTYDALGRITKRTDVASNATWTYHATKKHAVTQAGSSSFTYTYDANGNAITRNAKAITWDKYNYPLVINNTATENVTHSYDANHQRWKAVYVNGSTTETTIYVGGLLEKVTVGTAIDYRHYIYANGNTAAVATYSRKSSGTNTFRYILDDHQQSPSNIRDSAGVLVVNESFTAFGNRRNWSTWSGAANSTELTTSQGITRQGYTWQTALGNMGLNHMNGRVQDSITGVFISADPYISDPGNTQNYNRYSYVYNNPLSLIDPSGFWACEEMFGFTFAGGTGSGIYGPSANGFGSGGTLDSTPTQSGTWRYKPTTTTVIGEGGESMAGNGGNWFFTPDLSNRTLVPGSTWQASTNPVGGGNGGAAAPATPAPPPGKCFNLVQFGAGAGSFVVGGLQFFGGAAEGIAGAFGIPVSFGGTAPVVGVGILNMVLGASAARDGWSLMNTAFDGVQRGSTFEDVGQLVAGDTGQAVGNAANMVVGVASMATAVNKTVAAAGRKSLGDKGVLAVFRETVLNTLGTYAPTMLPCN